MKEKQIATYLECRKTFFGRIKYFLKSKKNKKKEDTKEQITEKQEEEKVEKQEEFLQKDYYTIEDIVQIYKELDEKSSKVKNFELDINALKNKIKSMEIKINNANQYIEEIDKHEKNIFEFWKFTNKDENLLLNEGEKQVENTTKKIEKVYDYKEDIEEVGNIIDKAVRQNFNKNELDYIYLLTTNIFEVIKKFEDEELLQQSLENLKQEIDTTERLFSTEKDIFGNLSEDATKIKVLGNKKHREIAKDKIKILEIDNNTTIEEYKNKIASINENIKKYIDEAKSIISIPIYIAIPNKEKLEGLQTFSINPEEAINNCKAEGEIYLHKINIKQGNPLIFFSNSVYFENNNKTLPYGMNMGTRGVINVNNYKIKNTTKDEFRINHLVADKYSTKKILLNEYEIIQNEEEN